MTFPADLIEPLCGNVLLSVRQERGFVVLEFSGGKRVQIYACAKVESDYSADCWLGIERCDLKAP